ncbi:MAG TPA: hypothetical protein PK398_02725, partial [Candidatus Gracilibacteria bacterium]|nr:hypothetical protein [Candidatus Gracilibacteria bacterium]
MVFEIIKSAVNRTAEKVRSFVNGIFPPERKESNFAKLVENANEKALQKPLKNIDNAKEDSKTSLNIESNEDSKDTPAKKYKKRFNKASQIMADSVKALNVDDKGVSMEFSAPVALEDVFMPDVVEIELVEGGKSVKAKRKVVGDKVGYYFQNTDGKETYLELPENSGEFKVSIQNDQLLNLTPEEVEKRLEEEEELIKKHVAENTKRDLYALGEIVTEDKPEIKSSKKIPSKTKRTPSRNREFSESTPVPSPDSSLSGSYAPTDELPPSSELLDPVTLHEADGKPLEAFTPLQARGKEVRLSTSESPTGQPLYINYPEDPELKKKPVEYFVFFHGMHGSIDVGISKLGLVEKIEQLRMSGVNAVLVIPQSSSYADRTQWDYFLNQKNADGMFSYCEKLVNGGNEDTTEKNTSQKNINLISFSGGYRAVSAILRKSSYASRVNQISMIDSIYEDGKFSTASVLAEFVKKGGKLFAVTSSKEKNKSTTAGAEAVRSEMRRIGADLRLFNETKTDLGHWQSAVNFLMPQMLTIAGISTPEQLDQNEKFVKGSDHFNNEVVLRDGAYQRFRQAMEVAEKKHGLRLYVFSSYRSHAEQQIIWNRKIASVTEKRRKKGLSLDIASI